MDWTRSLPLANLPPSGQLPYTKTHKHIHHIRQQTHTPHQKVTSTFVFFVVIKMKDTLYKIMIEDS